MDVLNRIYLFLFILSLLNIIRHTLFIIRNIVLDEKIMMDKRTLLLLGTSISYVVMSIILK